MTNKYTVQRPAVIWLETVVEASGMGEALALASTDFENGDYLEIDGTWEIDFDRYWVQTHDGLVFTESHAPRPNA